MIQWIINFFKRLFEKKQKSATNDRLIFTNKNTQIDEQDWKVENQVDDVTSNVLKVLYREKYGSPITKYCLVLFKNDKTRQYKLVAPWYESITLEMSNITTIEIQEVNKSNVVL